MSRLTAIKRLMFATFAAGGLVVACRAASPGEAPPLAPRPDLGEPTNPVPGAPDPFDPPDPGTPGPSAPTENDAGAGPIPQAPTGGPVSSRVELRSSTPMQTPPDAGVDATRSDARRSDATAADASGTDASRADASPIDASTVAPRDGRVPDAADSGVTGLPPVSDAQLPMPPDAVRPLH